VTVDTGALITPVIGRYTAITIGSNGLPLIAYHFPPASGNKVLKFARCNDQQCSTSVATTVDSSSDVGRFVSLAIGVDGLPIMAYYDAATTGLKVAKCGDSTCSTSGVPITLAFVYEPDDQVQPSAFDVGRYASIAIGSGGVPIIAYTADTAPGEASSFTKTAYLKYCQNDRCLPNGWVKK
jgi:hypothetical protein